MLHKMKGAADRMLLDGVPMSFDLDKRASQKRTFNRRKESKKLIPDKKVVGTELGMYRLEIRTKLNELHTVLDGETQRTDKNDIERARLFV